jgi:hypothetical protein
MEHSMSELDDLYWHSDLAVTEVAARCGVPAARLHARVAPFDTGLPCYRCGESVGYSSRSQREEGRPRCLLCGCTRRDPAHARPSRWPRAAPSLVGGVVMVCDAGDDIGWDVEACVDVLAKAGIAWGDDLVIVAAGSTDVAGDFLRAAGERPPGVLAVPSLAELGATQSERLQALFGLTRMRWRVLTAGSIHVCRPSRPITAGDLDELDDEPRYPGELGFVSRLVDATANRRGWVS